MALVAPQLVPSSTECPLNLPERYRAMKYEPAPTVFQNAFLVKHLKAPSLPVEQTGTWTYTGPAGPTPAVDELMIHLNATGDWVRAENMRHAVDILSSRSSNYYVVVGYEGPNTVTVRVSGIPRRPNAIETALSRLPESWLLDLQ